MRVQASRALRASGRQPLIAARQGGARLLASWPGRYGVALGGSLLALLLMNTLWPIMPTVPFMFFFLAVMVAGWWGGWGPALVSIAFALLAVGQGFLPPSGLPRQWPGKVLPLVLFTLVSLLITWLNVSRRRINAERVVLLEREQTARRKAEEAERSLQRLADSIPAIVWSAGADGINDYYNWPWYEYAGIPQGSLDFELATRVCHPEDLASNGPRWNECLERGEPFQGEYRLLRASDHSWRWHLTRTVPWKDASGRVAKWFGTSIDIDEQKRAEHLLGLLARAGAVLGASLDEAETLTAAARLAVPAFADWCLVDLQQADGTFQRVQAVPAAAEDAELARQALRFSLMPGGDSIHLQTRALSRGEALLFEHFTPESLARGGHTEEHARLMQQAGLLSGIAVPLVARGSTLGVLSFFTSRSGRHYTKADLPVAEELARRVALSVDNARLYKSAQEAVRLRDEFLSVASHELKTPLTPLSLKLQVLAQKAAAQPESPFAREVLSHVEVGRKQVRKLGVLIGDLLDVSRISAGRMQLFWQPVDFAALVREVASRYEAQVASQGTPLWVEAPASLVGTWDAMRLEQVVVNLLDNALKYGPGKPVRLRLAEDSERAVLTVEDQGIGIAPEAQERIFERFMRGVSDRNYGGLGLGLYITKSCVEAMGGTIHVQSEPGKGAAFTVVLPRRAARAS